MDVEEMRPTRRTFIGAAVALSVGMVGLNRAFAHDDKDEDDHDNSGHGSDDHSDDNGDHGIPPGTTPVSGVTEIAIVDERYDPPSVIIDPGQTLTWTNKDHDNHSATGATFDTGIIAPGATVKITFTEPGTFRYQCVVHPEMEGEVVVRGEATPVATPATPTAANAVAVKIVDFAFDPATIKIPAGTTVTWTNSGASPHTVNGDGLDSGTLMAGATFSFTFDTPGTVSYACAFHPQMTGTIDVS